MPLRRIACLLGAGLVLATTSVNAQSDDDLAKQLANPIASLISVPLELVYDQGLGPSGTGSQTAFVAKPVIPFNLNEDWNVISRTIIPYVWQRNLTSGTSKSGFSDVTQSFFFSPKAPTSGGVVWGAGPVFQMPLSASNGLGRNAWGAGLTGVALKQTGGWTVGMLANHIWDIEGKSAKQSRTFLQPFVNFTTQDAWTYALNTESTYDWVAEEWSIPINFKISKLVQFGRQRVSLSLTTRYWAQSPAGGPDGWGATFGATLLFPK